MGSPTFSSTEVCEKAGISFRQLDHWRSKGFVRPQREPRGPGDRVSYAQDEMQVAVSMGRLVAAGLELASAHDAARQMASGQDEAYLKRGVVVRFQD